MTQTHDSEPRPPELTEDENTPSSLSESHPSQLAESENAQPDSEFKRAKLKFQEKYATWLVFGGFVFLGISIAFMASGVLWIFTKRHDELEKILAVNNTSTPFWLSYLLVNNTALLEFLVAATCIVVGYQLIVQAGGIGRETIPEEDVELIERLKDSQLGVLSYIQLKSLTGATGFFTKIGITGLPLATIFLTLTFGILGFLLKEDGNAQNKFFDLANLTLGAFLGSYVQKQGDKLQKRTNPDDQD